MASRNEDANVATFKAEPQDTRKTIAVAREVKVLHPNLVPEDIANDEFLNSLIDESLPKNYNFEIKKTIWKIKQTESKLVLLQFPEGLIRFGPVIVDVMSAYFKINNITDIRFITMGDLTYGACCIDDYLGSSMGVDLIVHYAHSCLVPINKLNNKIKYLYIFLDIRFDMDHVLKCISHNFEPEEHRIAMASTIQFVASVHELAKRLREKQYDITLPNSRPLSSGEVLGCTAPKLDAKINTIIFICDGRFHLEAMMIANPDIQAYRYDPYQRKLTREGYNFKEMYGQRQEAIDKAVRTMKGGGTFGFVLGTLGRQGNEQVYDRLVSRLAKISSCKFVKVLIPEVTQTILQTITGVDVWVQVACPRLSIDWGKFFECPLLNSYEFAKAARLLYDSAYVVQDANSKPSYPMDFYATQSCGDHTPNHSCIKNTSCSCSKNPESPAFEQSC